MIRLAFICDGPRDFSIVPHLVQTMLGEEIEPAGRFVWKHLPGKRRQKPHRGVGLKPGLRAWDRRLSFVVAIAKRDALQGIVATVDRDRRNRKESQLNGVRGAIEKLVGAPPVACGEANPHCEVWLLDDQKAVRDSLKLAADISIPDSLKTDYPKAALDELIDQSPGTRIESLREIAKQVRSKRCIHRDRTGFAEFERDVTDRLKHIQNPRAART